MGREESVGRDTHAGRARSAQPAMYMLRTCYVHAVGHALHSRRMQRRWACGGSSAEGMRAHMRTPSVNQSAGAEYFFVPFFPASLTSGAM